MHVGVLQAVQYSKVLKVDSKKFMKVTMKHTGVLETTALYAQRFIELLNSASSECPVTDLSKPNYELLMEDSSKYLTKSVSDAPLIELPFSSRFL